MAIREDEFKEALSAAEIRLARILVGAIVAGAVIILGVVVLVIPAATPRGIPDDSRVRLLTTIGLVLTASGLSAALHLPRILLRRAMARATSGPELATSFRTATIVRMALSEGGALFGCVVLLIASLGGVLVARPIYWINALPVAFHVALGVVFWPSRDAWIRMYRELR